MIDMESRTTHFIDPPKHFIDDITYCDSDCQNYECGRHKSHISSIPGTYSFSNYFQYACRDYKPPTDEDYPMN